MARRSSTDSRIPVGVGGSSGIYASTASHTNPDILRVRRTMQYQVRELGRSSIELRDTELSLHWREMAGMSSFSIMASIPHETQAVIDALLATGAFGLLGLGLMLLGFKGFEFATRRVDIEKQLENGNLAVGIVVAALLLGVSLIVIVSML